MKRTLLLFLFASLIGFNASAQKGGNSTTASNLDKKGHEITFNIKNSKDAIVYLVIHYNEKLILKDSTTPAGAGKFVFKGDNRYDDGMYSLVSEKKKLYLNFIIDNNQHFTYNLDTSANIENFSTVNSPENEEMLKFQRKTSIAQKNANLWSKKIKEFEEKKIEDSVSHYQTMLSNINTEMMDFIHTMINAHPDYLFSKMQKSYLEPEIPEFKKENGEPDYEARRYYYCNHYWDNFDLGDHRFIYLPSFEPKLKQYFYNFDYPEKDKYPALLQNQPSDTVNKYIDPFLAKTEKDTLMYHYCVDWLSYRFETSKTIGHDAVFCHIAKNNQLAGKCYWLDEDILSKYKKRIKRLEPTLIGKIAPELIIPDTNLYEDARLWKSSYSMTKPYTILWFYDPNCPTCKKESKTLRQVYDSLEQIGQRNFDVYSIGNDDTIEAWKKYVKENNYPWTQVGGNKGNLDYLDYFGIYEIGNPAMFILNDKHEIILNRRIDMRNIPQFLEEYEKLEKSKTEKRKEN